MADFISDVSPEPTGDYAVGKLDSCQFSSGDWSGATAVNFALAETGKRAMVVGIIASNQTGSPITLDIYSSVSVIGSITIPARSTKTFFDERGLMLSGVNQVARTSGTGSGTRTVIWRYV